MMRCICQKEKGETQFLLYGSIKLNQQGQRRRVSITIANEISNVTFSVMPTCSASFFKNPDASGRQAGMTTLKSYVNLLNAFVLTLNTDNALACKDRLAEPR